MSLWEVDASCIKNKYQNFINENFNKETESIDGISCPTLPTEYQLIKFGLFKVKYGYIPHTWTFLCEFTNLRVFIVDNIIWRC